MTDHQTTGPTAPAPELPGATLQTILTGLIWASMVPLVVLTAYLAINSGASTAMVVAIIAAAVVAMVLAGTLAGRLIKRRLNRALVMLTQALAPGVAPPTSADIVSVRRLLDEAAKTRASTEATLRESEQRFRQLFELAPLPLALVNKSGAVADSNQCFTEVFGYSRGELPTMEEWRVRAYPDPAYRAWVRETWEAAVKKASISKTSIGPLESRIHCKDGTERFMMISGIMIGNHFLATFFDVTERKKAEDAVQAGAALYQHTLDNMLEGCQVIGSDWRYRYLNTASERQNGQSRDKLIGRTMMEVYPGLEETGIFATLSRCMEDRIAQHTETTFAFPDGRQGWFDVNVLPAPDGISIFSVDITESKLAEQALRESQAAALKEQRQARLAALNLMEDAQAARARAEAASASLRELSLAVEQSPESIVISDLQNRIEYVNAACVQTTGYARQELLGQHIGMLRSDRTRQSDIDAIWASLSVGQTWKGELFSRRKDGTEFVEFAIVSPLRQADGRVTHYVGVREDITEKKRLSVELDRHRHHLEELVASRTSELEAARALADAANQAKSAFLANMSHEIRTPMNAIIGLNYLLRQSNPSPLQNERLTKIDAAAQHLMTILNDILDLSKIEVGRLELEQTDFPLASVLDNVRSIAELARAKGLTIKVDEDDVPLWLHGDPTRVRQALLNFAGNAVKFTERGTVWLRARLLEDSDAGLLLRFEVQDTGVGISAQQLATLFESFTQADASTTRKFGGTGLGLAITRRLAQLMGGEAGGESRLGEGSTFWFTVRLKRGQSTAQPVPEAVRDTAAATLSRNHAGARILLAEDNPVNREVGRELLQRVGLWVDTAENGRLAVEKIQSGAYDLVLMDVQMPEMDGLAATSAIRAQPAFAPLPILAMTANAFDEDRRACLACGMNDFVSKPVVPKDLYATLLRWLSRSHRVPSVAAPGHLPAGPSVGALLAASAASAPPAQAAPVAAPSLSEAVPPLQIKRLEDITGLDLAWGLNIVGGNRAQLLRFLRKFAHNHAHDMATVLKRLVEGDVSEARRLTHSVKGAAATLGVRQVADLATELDAALHHDAPLAECMRLARQGEAAMAQMVSAIHALPEEI